jgi:uncharacterized MAPEG superfamily protein
METAVASTELSLLCWSVILLLLQVVAQATAASDLGPTYLFSPRDEQRESKSVIAGRLGRALNNLLETYPAFVALALGLIVTGKTGGLGETGAWIWLTARVAYVIIYAAGIPVVRTLVWLASIIGLVLMLIRLMA